MYSDEFISNQVKLGALRAGASPRRADEYALIAVSAYKKNSFKKAGALLDKCIKDAAKQTKKDEKEAAKSKQV